MIDAITGLSLDNPSQSISAGTLDKDAFLQLLVAQIRYQNPLEPMDSQEYLAQTAQFAMVERIEEMAKSQSASMSFQRAQLSASLVGQHVTGIDPVEGEVVSGVVDAVAFNEGKPVLLIGESEIGLENVTSVAKPDEDSAVVPADTVDPVEADPTEDEPTVAEPIADEVDPVTDEVDPVADALAEDDLASPETSDGSAVTDSGNTTQPSSPIDGEDRAIDDDPSNVVEQGIDERSASPIEGENPPNPDIAETGIDTPIVARSAPIPPPPIDGTKVDEVADESNRLPPIPANPAPVSAVAEVDVTEEQAFRFADLTSRVANQTGNRSTALRDAYLAGSSRNG